MAEKKKIILPLAAAAGVGMIVWGLTKATGEPSEPGLPVTYSNLVVPDMVPVGSIARIAVDVTNPNDYQVKVTVILEGSFSKSRDVTIEANSTVVVAFGVQIEEAGTYTVIIDGLSATFKAGLMEVELSNLVASPEIVTIGQDVRISVNVGNPNWETSVTYLVQLTGVIQAEQEITLLPHETKTVRFTETVDWLAWGTIYCDGLSVRVKGEEYVEPDEPMPPGWDDELAKEINDKYKEFLDQLVMAATDGAGGYMSDAWWDLTMQERHDLTVEAEDMARQWFYDTYGYWWPF